MTITLFHFAGINAKKTPLANLGKDFNVHNLWANSNLSSKPLGIIGGALPLNCTNAGEVTHVLLSSCFVGIFTSVS